MWRAWIGFNASHSSGAIYIGLVNFIVAIQFPDFLRSPTFVMLNIVTVVFYCWLGKKYWFGIPFKAILMATACFVSAALLFILS
jgi:hypothetical protein